MLSPSLADYVVAAWLNKPPVEGAIGVEIEMELKAGNHAGWYDSSKMWDITKDGSLRLNGLEAVLTNPMNIGQVDEALEDFQKAVKHCKMKFVENSRRTSVHVHVNVQEKRILDLYNIISCYWIVEPLLIAYSGPHRRGNNFCLSSTEAEGVVFDLCAGAADERHFQGMFGEENRYGAMNIAAIGKYGSLEFRSMRGVYDSPTLRNWINVIYDLTWKACGFKNPFDILSFMSRSGEDAFLELLFPPAFIHDAKKAYGDNWRDAMREGAMSVLELANSRESWDISKDEVKAAYEALKAAKKRPAPKPKPVRPNMVNEDPVLNHGERMIRRQVAMRWIEQHPIFEDHLVQEANENFVVWRWGINGVPAWASRY